MKTCSRCHKEKELEEFYVKRNKPIAACKECTIKRSREYAILNEERDRQKRKDQREKTSRINTIRASEWNKNNQIRRKEIANAWAKKYRTGHKEEYLEYIRAWGKKRLNNPAYRVSSRMRWSIWESLKGTKYRRKWQELVGYSLQDLRMHLENQFQPGMSWENYGLWHIDHIIPISAFNFTKSEDIDFKKCWALKNLQPLWAIDNLKKHAKIQSETRGVITG